MKNLVPFFVLSCFYQRFSCLSLTLPVLPDCLFCMSFRLPVSCPACIPDCLSPTLFDPHSSCHPDCLSPRLLVSRTARLPSFLSSRLTVSCPACLTDCLSSVLPVYRPACLPLCFLPSCVPPCLSSSPQRGKERPRETMFREG
jgi:hypothetical protein